jgi:hypothetical protein
MKYSGLFNIIGRRRIALLFIPMIILLISSFCFFRFSIPYSFNLFISSMIVSNNLSECVLHATKLTHNLSYTNGWPVYALIHRATKTANISQYWNGNDRFRPLDMPSTKCVIIYCGANIGGTDGIRFAREYPLCHIYFLEPVTAFFEQLLHSSAIKKTTDE